MSGLILGTAGHVDHGKSALVRALTGVDPDRLQQEKERGITIELGFAELDAGDGIRFGVVDVPGHEAFVRAMVAGAAGVDVVLLVIAADEGVMPQTREHLAILELLGVPELLVVLTKCDLVDEEWLELVSSDVDAVLEGTPYQGARKMHTSVVQETGLDELRGALREVAARVEHESAEDLVRLPLDRVFTIQGTGTVATGTLWSGALEVGDRVRILPQEQEARIRALQVHGREVASAGAGARTAVALAGDGADRGRLDRGAVLVTEPHWRPSLMLTARARILEDTEWALGHNQRVRVHLGTAEVLARCALLEEDLLGPGEAGWVQLRLEAPVAARARDRLVIRAYSPVTTIGGGVVAEVTPPKRGRLDPEIRAALEAILEGDDLAAVEAALALAGWGGLPRSALALHTGLPPAAVASALGGADPAAFIESAQALFGRGIRAEGERLVLESVERGHAFDSLRPSVPLAEVRASLPRWAPAQLADALIAALVASGRVEAGDGGIRRPGYLPEPTAEQEDASRRLEQLLRDGGLAPPFVDEFPPELAGRPDLRSLLRRLEQEDRVRQVADGYYVTAEALEEAAARVSESLGGRSGLGPSDFRDALPVSRKWLIPLLNHLDGRGVTVRHDGGRDVPMSP